MNQVDGSRPSYLNEVFDFVTAGMSPPGRVVFGCGAIKAVGREAIKLGRGKALLVADDVIEGLGLLEQVKVNLEDAGLTVEVYTDIDPEPHIETAKGLCDFGAGRDISVMVAVGGGSVMDMAKLAAQCLAAGKPVEDYASRKATPESRSLPLILAPTTSGTGSEVSMNLVLGVGEDKIFLSSPYYYPDIAVIDPELTVSMPPMVTANTGIDALSHAVEGLLHKKSNPLSDTLCLSSIEMVGKYLRRAAADGQDMEARYHMSMAASLAMMGMVMSGGLYAHSVSYAIAKYRALPHGLGCGLALPYTMAYNLPVAVPKLIRIAAAMGERIRLLSDLDAAQLAVDSVIKLNKDIGLPLTLKELGGLQENDLEDMADLMLANWPRPMNPRPMGQAEARRFWRNMWA